MPRDKWIEGMLRAMIIQDMPGAFPRYTYFFIF